MAGYYVRLKVPRLWDSGWGLDLQTGFNFGFGRYYGRGNDSANIRAFTEPKNPHFKDRHYYQYILERWRFVASLSRQIRAPLAVAVSFSANKTLLSPRGGQSLLFAEQPDAGRRQTTGTLGGRLLWDTRDDEVIPRHGVLHEWSYETSRGALLDLFLDELDLDRFTFTDVRFFALSRRLVLGNRFVFEVLRGSEKPVDTLGEIGPSRSRFKGLGGFSSLRGFDAQRFVDDVRFVGNTELRYRIAATRWLGQYLEWHSIAFVDVGRVWPRPGPYRA